MSVADEDGDTPLHNAARGNHTALVAALLQVRGCSGPMRQLIMMLTVESRMCLCKGQPLILLSRLPRCRLARTLQLSTTRGTPRGRRQMRRMW